jgi:hypothetical protein
MVFRSSCQTNKLHVWWQSSSGNQQTIPHSLLKKRHNALSYHRVHDMIAAKVLGYYWIDGKKNPADVVSKHWGHQQCSMS